MNEIDNQIQIIDDAICRNIECIDFTGRGAVSQDVLKKLRDLIEHIMLKIAIEEIDIENNYNSIKSAIKFVKKQGHLMFLWKFHDCLQKVASHYLLDTENSERVMLKYYEYLLKIKIYMKSKYAIVILKNIDKYPLNTDINTQNYYKKISTKLNNRNIKLDLSMSKNERYYIHKIKPFFIREKIYYEVTFFAVTSNSTKFNRVTAFTALDISKYYSVKLWTVDDNIQILNKTMPIIIIVKWEVSIRPCEIRRLSNIFGDNLKQQGSSLEYRGLMQYLTETGYNLIDILLFDDEYYEQVKNQIISYYNAKVNYILNLLTKIRGIILLNKPGCNVLRYLLYHLNNVIMKNQLNESNTKLSNLHLGNKCIPFDEMPFATSLIRHNPKLEDLFDCIDLGNRFHELLARHIRNNTEQKGQLYTSLNELQVYENIDSLIKTYNSKLYWDHQGRRIEKRNQYLYIRDYENDTIAIINRINELSKKGIQNYCSYVDEWLLSCNYLIDCEEKKNTLYKIFDSSSVALIYGSAGTGKTTLINHISNLFAPQEKLLLSNTNPAVDNLKRRVNASNCTFMTTTKYLMNVKFGRKYDLLVIDECSTISNNDMKCILNETEFDLLILVGDIYQIEAIQFGNWFHAIRGFLPNCSIFELVSPHRSKDNKDLQTLWDRVRNMEDTIIEFIARKRYSVSLDNSIFESTDKDEIILCLNYDGLYGINNINRFLQETNGNNSVYLGLQVYKIGDPILFNESERFAPLIYNNLKGWILDIVEFENEVRFDIELEKVINGLEARRYDFDLLDNYSQGHSVIRFSVNKTMNTDEDDYTSSSSIMPFQVSYAISIHKAQGLEYQSVKIVISDEIEELITHDIFYTAITRTREKLKIYWTPEVENRVLSRIKPRNIDRDVALLKYAMETDLHKS
ncbi:MAG: AAA family ATPase [Bacteroidales bacterium]|nr:AAA family ATPase [Bacteroidales bacterium]